MKCHDTDKKKDGPPYKEIAGKYKDKPDAMAKLTKHITEPSKVKIDGVEEDHGSVLRTGKRSAAGSRMASRTVAG